MARTRTILQSEFPYHISARCINRQWFDIPIDEVWDLTSDYLYLLHHGFEFRIHSFVLMSNHYHLIATTPRANVDEGMEHFQREVSRQISKLAGRINQTWGGPYDPCVVDSYSYYLNAYKYVYRNPIMAGLSETCEDYQYSSLSGLVGQRRLSFPVQEDTLLFDPELNSKTLIWLNTAKDEDATAVGQALRKAKFRFEKCRNNNRPIREDNFIF